MLDLPFQRFKSLLQNDSLNIHHEKYVLELVREYLKHREKLPTLPEEDPWNDWSHLNAEEKKAR